MKNENRWNWPGSHTLDPRRRIFIESLDEFLRHKKEKNVPESESKAKPVEISSVTEQLPINYIDLNRINTEFFIVKRKTNEKIVEMSP